MYQFLRYQLHKIPVNFGKTHLTMLLTVGGKLVM